MRGPPRGFFPLLGFAHVRADKQSDSEKKGQDPFFTGLGRLNHRRPRKQSTKETVDQRNGRPKKRSTKKKELLSSSF
jgi:hypothetical protein